MKIFYILITTISLLFCLTVSAENNKANLLKNDNTDSEKKPPNWFVKTQSPKKSYSFTQKDNAEIIKLTKECLIKSDSFSNCTNKSRDIVAKKAANNLAHTSNNISIQSQNRSAAHPLLVELNCTDDDKHCVLCFYNNESKTCSTKIEKNNKQALLKAKAFVSAIGASDFQITHLPEKAFNANAVVSIFTPRVCNSLVKSVNLESEINVSDSKIQEYLLSFQKQCPSKPKIKGLLKTGIQ